MSVGVFSFLEPLRNKVAVLVLMCIDQRKLGDIGTNLLVFCLESRACNFLIFNSCDL